MNAELDQSPSNCTALSASPSSKAKTAAPLRKLCQLKSDKDKPVTNKQWSKSLVREYLVWKLFLWKVKSGASEGTLTTAKRVFKYNWRLNLLSATEQIGIQATLSEFWFVLIFVKY